MDLRQCGPWYLDEGHTPLEELEMIGDRIGLKGHIVLECRGADGALKWREEIENLVVDEGVNHILDTALSGSAQVSAYYVGLKGTGTPAASDTMASHATWSEITPYSNATRPAWTEDNTAGDKKVSNSASPASFNINASATVVGAFLTTDSTKGGTVGKLIAAGDASASKAVTNGDTLNVTYEISA